VRATRKAPDSSYGRRICPFRFALYSTEAYLERAGEKPLPEHRYCLVEGTVTWLVPTIWPT
jgi:hypothetical protein